MKSKPPGRSDAPPPLHARHPIPKPMSTQDYEKTVAELAALVGGRVIGDGGRVVGRVASTESAREWARAASADGRPIACRSSARSAVAAAVP